MKLAAVARVSAGIYFCVAGSGLSGSASAKGRSRNVVIFVADGLRPGSLNPTDAPTLVRLQKEGVFFSNSHSLYPTVTTANASAIATGHLLGDTGDFANTLYVGTHVTSGTPFIEDDRLLSLSRSRRSVATRKTRSARRLLSRTRRCSRGRGDTAASGAPTSPTR